MSEQNDESRKEHHPKALAWLRGDLPTWVAVALIGALTWGAREAYQNFQATLAKAVDTLHNHDIRITVLEDRLGAKRDAAKSPYN